MKQFDDDDYEEDKTVTSSVSKHGDCLKIDIENVKKNAKYKVTVLTFFFEKSQIWTVVWTGHVYYIRF